jgi:Asp-tRNA(Asn)/Glu-tRNA(Gln) amidotransferase A subunit family amidase
LRRNVERSVGLPVGVQVIGLPFEEEKVLGLMKFIEREIQFNSKYRPSAL